MSDFVVPPPLVDDEPTPASAGVGEVTTVASDVINAAELAVRRAAHERLVSDDNYKPTLAFDAGLLVNERVRSDFEDDEFTGELVTPAEPQHPEVERDDGAQGGGTFGAWWLDSWEDVELLDVPENPDLAPLVGQRVTIYTNTVDGELVSGTVEGCRGSTLHVRRDDGIRGGGLGGTWLTPRRWLVSVEGVTPLPPFLAPRPPATAAEGERLLALASHAEALGLDSWANMLRRWDDYFGEDCEPPCLCGDCVEAHANEACPHDRAYEAGQRDAYDRGYEAGLAARDEA